VRIGIDFDNTIACYDRSFPFVANLLGLLNQPEADSKSKVKKQLGLQKNGDINWQHLQGKVYGRYMLEATIFPGFIEFLYLSKLRGHQLYIISHKTKFGHFDKELVPLRDQAFKWLDINDLVGDSVFAIPKKNIYFEETREDKINRINELDCTYFIDDLSEIFAHGLFPANTKKILFNNRIDEPNDISLCPSWREISKIILGEITEIEICEILRIKFPKLDINKAALINGRGNSRIYRLYSNDAKEFALKIYPDRHLDPRLRLKTEVNATHLLKELGFPVIDSCANDNNLDWAIFPWINGHKVDISFDNKFIDLAFNFVHRLYINRKNFDSFEKASEACLCGYDIENQISARLNRLENCQSNILIAYLKSEFSPIMDLAVQRAKNITKKIYFMELSKLNQIPSPSDFGAHNCIRKVEGDLIFIDFEYFGWDDPVKLISDFYWHPAMSLSRYQRILWVEYSKELFKNDILYEMRLNSYLPKLGLRWFLIILNEFMISGQKIRSHANPESSKNINDLRLSQLTKSRKLLLEIKEILHVNG